jgi:hypothetical protein
MADYKELIRKAIEALPENNGAARRAVYEKARAALVGQLRGLNPPLAARDITQHRLQLEDCIRQVEQEASEQVIAGLKQNEDYNPPHQAALPPPRLAVGRQAPPAARQAGASPRNGAAPRPESPNGTSRPAPAAVKANGAAAPRPLSAAPRQAPAAAPPRPAAARAASPRIAAPPHPQQTIAAAAPARSVATARPQPRPPAPLPRSLRAEPERVPDSIEEIIAAAEDDLDPMDFEEEVFEDEAQEDFSEPEPPLFKLEERRTRKPAAPSEPMRLEAPRAEARQLPAIVARAEAAKAGRSAPRNGADAPRRANGEVRTAAAARQQSSEPIRLPRQQQSGAAMSSVREVDLEGQSEGDAQVAIERAIATLEREARNDGESSADDDEDFERAPVNGRRRNGNEVGFRDPSSALDAGFARAPVEAERGGGSAVTIFLVVFLVLLIGAGGGGYWAWREGFIDFDAMFGKSAATSDQASATDAAPVVTTPAPAATPATPPTNTEAAPSTAAQSSRPLTTAPAPNDAPAATPVPVAPAPAAEPSAQTGVPPKSEDRLSTADAGGSAASPDAGKAAPDAVATGGSQSLLLEASQDGTTGAVPFSGTVDWSKGTDEMGQPTLVGKANIPARNLGVSVLIRKNNDPQLPASHLMEINFTVNASFAGGAIASLPGVLLKNEELVQGTPLIGASARVVGNSFLFALSSSAADEATNKDLLTSRKWMDLAVIYSTGKKAIITLEKDDKTEQLFNDVFTAWGKQAAAPAPTPAAN